MFGEIFGWIGKMQNHVTAKWYSYDACRGGCLDTKFISLQFSSNVRLGSDSTSVREVGHPKLLLKAANLTKPHHTQCKPIGSVDEPTENRRQMDRERENY